MSSFLGLGSEREQEERQEQRLMIQEGCVLFEHFTGRRGICYHRDVLSRHIVWGRCVVRAKFVADRAKRKRVERELGKTDLSLSAGGRQKEKQKIVCRCEYGVCDCRGCSVMDDVNRKVIGDEQWANNEQQAGLYRGRCELFNS